MTRDDDFIGQLEDYLDEYEGQTPLPPTVRDAVRAQLQSTEQIGWLGTPMRRFPIMSNIVRFGVAAAAVIAVAIFGYSLLRGSDGVGPPAATPTLTPLPTPMVSGSTPPAGSYTVTPFEPGGFGMCPPVGSGKDCTEDPRDDSIMLTYRAPGGAWEAIPGGGLWLERNSSPGGAAVIFHRGNWLYSDPCRSDELLRADISVGPTVDDFATALDSHPLLEVTTPVDVTLAGYSGKYTELQVPSDLTGCVKYRPVEGTIYAQGPGQRWHLWILDVEGIRVVIQSTDYAGTSTQHQAELQDIVDSIQIEP
jgi:hypothetical protein